jgi:hypothetical protein
MVNYFAPKIFRNLGLSKGSSDLFATGFVGILKMVLLMLMFLR